MKSRSAFEENNLPQGASRLAETLGWRVFPCIPYGKQPLIASAAGGKGFKDASAEPSQVAQWWEASPLANIGVATGGTLGLLVVDVDGEDGERALAKFGALPPTPEAHTGKGRHLYFVAKKPALRSTARALGPQLDTRGEGGYVIAPPSIHPTGSQYRLVEGSSPFDLPLSPLPEAMAVALSKSKKPHVGVSRRSDTIRLNSRSATDFRAWILQQPLGLRDGEGRNNTAFMISCQTLRLFPIGDAARILQAWNYTNKEPLSEQTLQRIFRNALVQVTRRSTWA